MSARWKWVIGILSIVVVFALLACGIFFAWGYLFGGKPSVVITAPPSNYQTEEGEEVRVEARATGRSIERIELWVDEGLMDSASSPSPQDVFSAALTWEASGLGQHVLEVKAYTLSGREGEPGRVIISVVPTVAEVTPTVTVEVPPLETPTTTTTAPTATATSPSGATATSTTSPPPTGTPTETPVPPTATPTETPVPPTATPTSSPSTSCPATFTVSPERQGEGLPFELSWHVDGATALRLTGPEVGGHVGVTGPGGSRSVCCPPIGDHTYTLHVSCPGGDFDEHVTVEIRLIGEVRLVDFTAAYDNVHLCGTQNYATFRIDNTGTEVLESLRLEMDPDIYHGPHGNNEPFRAGPNDCGAGNDSLAPGATAYIIANIADTPPGTAATAHIRFCTEEGMGGLCTDQDVDFTVAGVEFGFADFTATYDNIHLCDGDPYATFRIENTGSEVLEWLELSLGGWDRLSYAPFYAGPNGCGVGSDSLAPGGTAYIITYFPGAAPGPATAHIRLCTEGGGGGLCADQDVDFTVPPTEVALVHFTATYDNVHLCGAGNYATFRIENTGTEVLEDLQYEIDPVHTYPYGTDAPFHAGPNGCGGGSDSLAPGDTAYIIAYLPSDAPPGPATAHIRLCTEDGGGGLCANRDVDFTVPGVVEEDDIHNFRATDVSDTELRVTVDYTYASDHGESGVYMSAYALMIGGSQVPGTGFVPGDVHRGDGTVTVTILMLSGSGTYISEGVRVCMYNSEVEFFCDAFHWHRSWIR